MPPGRRNRSAGKSSRTVSTNTERTYGTNGSDLSSAKSHVLMDDINRLVNDTLPLYFPSTQIAFKLLLCAGFTSAVWSHISDCDEVFNYWEPSHYLIFGKGFQTWEYAPQFALRSYMYLLIHAVPAYLYDVMLHPTRLLLFYFLRCVFAVWFTICAVYFYKSACREFGVNIGRMVIVFLVFSPGTFISSTAFLPSSFSMYMTLLSIGAWFQRRYELAILSTAFSAIISWPFAAIIGLPIAIDVIFRMKKLRMFLFWSACGAGALLLMQTEIDSSYYGKFVISPWNIVKYNLFTSHGPNLYGTESPGFYFVNGFLNFNFAFFLALFMPLILVCVNLSVNEKIRHKECLPYGLSLSSFYLWFLIFCFQPHKEERFMFPVYPLICLCAAVSFDSLQILWYRFFVKDGSHYLQNTAKFAGIFLTIFALMGVSRMIALYKGYHAPLDVYIELYKLDSNLKGKEINLCIGKEWHRYPSSFFLPSNRWNVHFIQSEFKGLLPGKYYTEGENPTAIFREDMNDENKEEPSHVVNIDICHFLIDLDTHEHTTLEPDYSHDPHWTVEYSELFLDSKKSRRWIRSFYIPLTWEENTKYLSYNLLRSTTKVINNNVV